MSLIISTFLIKAKLWLSKYMHYVLGAAIILFIIFLVLMHSMIEKPQVKRKELLKDILKGMSNDMQEEIAEKEVEAALQIGRAQGREEEVKAIVEEINKELDSRKRREQLAALLRRR